MRKHFFCLLLFATIFFATKSFAQNVAINEDGSQANPNAILDVKSFTKGVLLPRVSTTGRLAMPAVKGMLVFDSTAGAFFYNVPVIGWQRLATGTSASEPGTDWSVTGNSITAVNNFLGTVNNAPLLIKVNNQLSGLIDANSGSTLLGYTAGGNLGLRNTAFGNSSLNKATREDNTAVGYQSLTSNDDGFANTAIGSVSLRENTNGMQNTAIGSGAMFHNNGGGENTAVGEIALVNNSSGHWNTAVGQSTMIGNTTGLGNTAIGHRAGPPVGFSDLINSTAIGLGCIVNASNKVRIGNSAVTIIEGQVPFTTPSDGRFKYQVKEDVKGLDFIMQLRPVTYQFDVKRFDDKMRGNANSSGNEPMSGVMQASYNEAAAIRRTGFIAQEVEKAANATGYDFSGIIKPKTNEDHYSLSYESFVVPLVKAVQEQQRIIISQKEKMETQDKKAADLQRQIDELKQMIQHPK